MGMIFAPSDDIVAREIEGELIIVPLTAGIGDLEDELFSLNGTGKAIWLLIDGKRSLREIAASLEAEYEAASEEIAQDVRGLVQELVIRKILVEVSGSK